MNYNSTKFINDEDYNNHIYQTMIKVGVKLMQRESRGHSFQTHDLVHEAYLRIQSIDNIQWKDHSHFINVFTKIMKRVLIDYARNNNSVKRGGQYQHQPLYEIPYEDINITINNELSEALEALKGKNKLLYHIVYLRYFNGFNINEIANKTGLSAATVKRKWSNAKECLLEELQNYNQ